MGGGGWRGHSRGATAGSWRPRAGPVSTPVRACRGCVVPPLLPPEQRPQPRRPHGRAAAVGRCRAVFEVAAILRDLGFSAPEVYAEDHERGFLLIEDFGDDTYTRLLAGGGRRDRPLCAGDRTLVALQRAVARSALPACRPTIRPGCSTRRRCWPIGTRRRRSERRCRRCVRNTCRAGGAVLPPRRRPTPTLVLRDYHVDNLMLLPGRPGVRGAGCSISRTRYCGPAEL